MFVWVVLKQQNTTIYDVQIAPMSCSNLRLTKQTHREQQNMLTDKAGFAGQRYLFYIYLFIKTLNSARFGSLG